MIRHAITSRFPNADRRRQVFQLALPIIGGMVSQNVLNIVDTAMVGTLGDVALAAVGISSFANFMAMAIILGISAGVQAMAARRIGEGRTSESAVPLNGGLLLAVGIGIPLSAVLIVATPSLFPYLNADPAVQATGTPYLQIRMAAMTGVAMNFAFRGYWSAVHLTRLYMGTLILMHSLNIFLNWVFIFGNLGAPALGATGAGLATTLAIYTGTATYFMLALKHSRSSGFLHGIPSRETMLTMIRISLPASVQQLAFAAGMVVLFWIVGRVGTGSLAAANVLMTLTLVGILPALGYGLAAASLVGHALGRGDPEDARRWAWNVAMLAALTGLGLGAPAVFFPDAILGIFIHEPSTLELARVPLQLVGALMWTEGIGMVLLNAHLGAGDTKRIMFVTVILQWLLFLPAAYLVGPVLGYGLLAIWIANGIYRICQTIITAVLWERGAWQHVEV
ncbi:MAG: MATE family efflux transporter [Gammaproteobacteria bacterium]|nr:MAG: MATE family efflux transporter [Gammaproteobacteria bacterium]